MNISVKLSEAYLINGVNYHIYIAQLFIFKLKLIGILTRVAADQLELVRLARPFATVLESIEPI